jgi:O-antigen ligase
MQKGDLMNHHYQRSAQRIDTLSFITTGITIGAGVGIGLGIIVGAIAGSPEMKADFAGIGTLVGAAAGLLVSVAVRIRRNMSAQGNRSVPEKHTSEQTDLTKLHQ